MGVAPAVPAPHLDAYDAWLERRHHGEMDYMAASRSLRAHPENLLPGVRSVVAVTLNYHRRISRPRDAPKIAQYALGRDYHRVLRSKLKRLARWIGVAFPGSTARACVDSAPIFERDYANLAGLGWFGKNTLLIDSRRGSWFFIGLLLTDVEFAPDPPAIGGCGTCTACIDACPTGAIVFADGRWQIDAQRCISYQTIERRGALETPTHGWTFGCDICQEVCPFNVARPTQPDRATETSEPDFEPRSWPSLRELAGMTYEEWDKLTEGSAVRRAGWEGLRRNARANLEEG